MSKIHTYSKHEKLKSRKIIGEVFERGSVVKSHPLRAHFYVHDHPVESRLQCGFSVSKRNFKKAVDRNRIKRLLRESYRLNNSLLKQMDLGDNLAVLIVYASRKAPDYAFIERKMIDLLDQLQGKLQSSDKT